MFAGHGWRGAGSILARRLYDGACGVPRTVTLRRATNCAARNRCPATATTPPTGRCADGDESGARFAMGGLPCCAVGDESGDGVAGSPSCSRHPVRRWEGRHRQGVRRRRHTGRRGPHRRRSGRGTAGPAPAPVGPPPAARGVPGAAHRRSLTGLPSPMSRRTLLCLYDAPPPRPPAGRSPAGA